MFTLGFVFDHNIVDIDFRGPSDQGFEDLYHQPLISSANILEPKRHDLIAMQSMWHCEGHLLFVSLEHGDLVVFEECVYEGEHSMFDSGVYYFIYSGQRKTILWSSVIQIGVINIDSPLSSFLWINHHVRQPIRIFNFPDKLGCQQLVHLRLNDPLPNLGWKCRTFWRTGREEGMTLSRCEAIDE